jgi:hypothetical protein
MLEDNIAEAFCGLWNILSAGEWLTARSCTCSPIEKTVDFLNLMYSAGQTHCVSPLTVTFISTLERKL